MITRRMKWIVQQLKKHPGAIITHSRDEFMGKSFYTLEWGGDNKEPYASHEVTNEMKKKLVAANLIQIVQERPVYTKTGKFVTTERDYGLKEVASEKTD